MAEINLSTEVLENAIGVHRSLEKITPLSPLDVVAVQAMEELLKLRVTGSVEKFKEMEEKDKKTIHRDKYYHRLLTKEEVTQALKIKEAGQRKYGSVMEVIAAEFQKILDTQELSTSERLMYELLKRDADYEAAEETGLLKILPVAIGSDVYFIPSKVNYDLNVLNQHEENNRIYHQKVEKVVFNKRGWYLECDKDLEYGTGHILVDTFYKETWFTTEEEAEQALAEMKEGAEC